MNILDNVNDERYEKLVSITDNYIDENTRDTMITSKHSPLYMGLDNATDEEIEVIKEQYIEYERDYTKPLNMVKRLFKKMR